MYKINNFFKISVLLIIIFSSFLFGFFSYRNQNFLYVAIAKIYYFFESQNPKLLDDDFTEIENILNSNEFINNQKLYAEDIYNYVNNNSKSFRNDLINKIILPKEIIKINQKEPIDNYYFKKFFSKNIKNKFVIKVKFYEIENFGILEKENNKKLFIFIGGQGASRTPLEYVKLIELKEEIKKKGYDILTLSLAGIGYNRHEKNISFPSNPNLKRINISKESFKKIITGNTKYLRHIWLSYYDKNYPELFPISLFLSGNYYIIKRLENNYDEIIMVGLSGGAWQATMLSSLIPKIKYSYSFAGSIPKSFSVPSWNPHELMGGESRLWHQYDLWHFYFLSLFDENGLQNRDHNLIYGADDKCCFYPPYSSSFDKFTEELSIKGLDVIILENHGHHIEKEILMKKLIN